MKKIFMLVLIAMMAMTMTATAETKYESHVTVYSGEEPEEEEYNDLIADFTLVGWYFHCSKCDEWISHEVENQEEHYNRMHKKWYDPIVNFVDDYIIFWN